MNVLYVQPYIAHYRGPLYDELEARLAERGNTLTVAAGSASGAHALRGDTIQAQWLTTLPSYVVRTPAGEFKYRRGLSAISRRADVCVMELDVGNLNAWIALARRRRPPLILWGHGKSYTSASNRLNEILKRLQCRGADHVMTYTESGREHLIRLGLAADSVTSVGNATDTETLLRHSVDRRSRSLDFSEAFGVKVEGRRVAMYVGGLDLNKRVPFLLQAAARAFELEPSFLLLVAGSGSDQQLVQEAERHGYVCWLPSADRAAFADMAAVSSAVWMPGRVGLVAIDAMALGCPIFTTLYPFHAPEIELLKPGFDVHTLSDDPHHFAEEALTLMDDPTVTTPPTNDVPTIAGVAQRMLGVIDSTIERTRSATALDSLRSTETTDRWST